MPFVGDKMFSVTFKDDTVYAYACEPHPFQMNGRFVASSSPPPPPPPPVVRKLNGSVSAAGAVALSAARIAAGDYRLTIQDRSAKGNFHFVGPGVNRKTGIVLRGTQTWRLELAPGTYH